MKPSTDILTGNDAILDECIEAFAQARDAIFSALDKLYKVHRDELWRGRYDSWAEFCQDGLKRSRSLGDQYVAIYQHYVLDGTLTVNELKEADHALLYKYRKLKGTPKEQYDTIISLQNNNQSIRTIKTIEDGHTCEPVTVCKHCWKRMEI